jgi:hypothetical protein
MHVFSVDPSLSLSLLAGFRSDPSLKIVFFKKISFMHNEKRFKMIENETPQVQRFENDKTRKRYLYYLFFGKKKKKDV